MPGVYPPRIKLEAVEVTEETVLQKASKAIDAYLTNNVNLGPVIDIRILSNGAVEHIRSPIVGTALSTHRIKDSYGAILHPPTFRKYLAWGHPDGSVQIHKYCNCSSS